MVEIHQFHSSLSICKVYVIKFITILAFFLHYTLKESKCLDIGDNILCIFLLPSCVNLCFFGDFKTFLWVMNKSYSLSIALWAFCFISALSMGFHMSIMHVFYPWEPRTLSLPSIPLTILLCLAILHTTMRYNTTCWEINTLRRLLK